MYGSVNKVIIVGNLGADPEIRNIPTGRVANLSVATSESWKDKRSGERHERTEWHRVFTFNDGLIDIIEKYLSKGSKVYIEGKIKTETYEKDGKTQYSTKIEIPPFGGVLVMLGSRESEGGNFDDRGFGSRRPSTTTGRDYKPTFDTDGIDDDIPF